MTHVTCKLTAKNRDQLRNPTLCNPVWATFAFLAAVGAGAFYDIIFCFCLFENGKFPKEQKHW